MNRRQFSQYVAASLVGLPRLARGADSLVELPPAPLDVAIDHWRFAENAKLRWFEKSTLVGGVWLPAVQTVPVRKRTGEEVTDDAFDPSDCVDIAEVPEPLVAAHRDGAKRGAMTDFCVARKGSPVGPQPRASRRARDGRPPSWWLRDLDVDQLRLWLSTVEPPEAGVSGMTYLEHLTEGHSFDLAKVEGLTLAEQAKLHGAAHGGY